MTPRTFGRNFWRQAGERAFKSAAQAVVGAGILDGVNVLHLDVKIALGTILGGALLSLATSIISAPVGPADSPSTVTPTNP